MLEVILGLLLDAFYQLRRCTSLGGWWMHGTTKVMTVNFDS